MKLNSRTRTASYSRCRAQGVSSERHILTKTLGLPWGPSVEDCMLPTAGDKGSIAGLGPHAVQPNK